MLKFRNRLRKWMVMSRGGNTDRRRRGRKSTSTALSTIGSEFIRDGWNSFSLAWKPVWYTGWHSGVLACATSVVIVLFINISLTIYAATNPEYRVEGGVGTLYSGSCGKTKAIGMWLHLGINVLSTLLLSGSNYTQQCLAAPTRSEIDAAHARRRWMDIGVPSVRNLFMIKLERVLLWIAIGITSIPLHLLFNSAVFTTLGSHDFLITVVTNNHFEPGAYSNMTEVLNDYYEKLYHITDPDGEGYLASLYGTPQLGQLSSLLEEYNTSTQNYEDLEPSKCTKLYNNDFLSDHSNLFLIAKQSSNTTHNNTLLGILGANSHWIPLSHWMCDYQKSGQAQDVPACNLKELVANITRGDPWWVKLTTGDEVEIGGCKSQKTEEKCKVQFSLGIMIAVICCNLVKACSMVMAVVRSREPTLVTLGDAVDSFLRIPDPTTMGICFADRRFVDRVWQHGRSAGPRQWKQKGAQRWWTSVSKTRWITCNIFCSIIIVVAWVFLASGMKSDGAYLSNDFKSMWTRGFGEVNTVSIISLLFRNISRAILLANFPQTILSFLYLAYNSLFTCMLMGHEWSLFSRQHRSLRVTSPGPGQRSTYWLQVPYTYGIPLMTLSSLLHWLTSQSIFLVKFEMWDPLETEISARMSVVGYSCIAIISVLILGILALTTAVGMGYRQFAAETTTVGSCSAAISAACHASQDSEMIIGKKLRWGDVGNVPNLGVRHLTFSSGRGVGKPMFGAVYAGTAPEGE
ncbi:hypothetical protein HOY80DRAFT_1093543 [Tuber brumale]|nr:hypothetical protein HOY80DRAFT_1093543 [Tuber brumale]